MMIKKDTLPGGVLIDGTIHRDYELREQLVADEIEVMEGPDAARAGTSDGFYNVCIIARRLKFPLAQTKEEVTPALIMSMTATDFSHILKAGKAMGEERDGFRDAAEAAPDAGTGPA